MRGKGRVFLRPGKRNWRISYYGPLAKPSTKGRTWGEIRESAKTTDKKEAQKLLADRLHEVANHRKSIRKFQGPRPDRVTVNELLDALFADLKQRDSKSLYGFFGKDGKGGHAKPIRAEIGWRHAGAVTSDVVRTHIAQRQTEGRANATINRGLELLRQAFRLAVDDDKLAFVPKIPMLSEKGNARQGFFERPEMDALLPRLPPPVDDMVRFAYATGWRRGEILALRWEWVDRNEREIRLPDSKNGEPRTLPLDEENWQLIERRWQARSYPTPNGWVGTSAHVFHREGKPIPGTTLGKHWRSACRTAGLTGKLFHDLRRTAARDMIRGGAPESFVMKVTGHKTRAMLDRYNIVSTADMKEALRCRREYVESRPGSSNVVAFEGGRE